MCFDHDSHPPIAPIAGGALDGRFTKIPSAGGLEIGAFRARPATPTGAGIVILPDVRGLHPYYEELALRCSEQGLEAIAIDYFGRTAGVGVRNEGFEYMPHVMATTWAGISADIAAGVAALRAGDGDRPGVDATFTIGFCMGGRMSFLAATLGLDLAGVIGFYGTLVGPWRNDAPEPVALAGEMASPVLGLFGGADTVISPAHIEAFDAALTAATVDHELITYPGAPHSFFDRKMAEFADASASAWATTLAFIGSRGAGAA